MFHPFTDRAHSVFGPLLPGRVALREDVSGDVDTSLYAGEASAIAKAVPKRQAEFGRGRGCARAALCELGLPSQEILVGPGGAPVWPESTVGSITHSSGLVAAAVGWSGEFRAIGIDVEEACDLGADVARRVASGRELASAARVVPQDAAAALVFSAKEAIYKAWAPITRAWLDFSDVSLTFRTDGTFRACIHVKQPLVGQVLEGRHRMVCGRVATAIVMRR